MRFGDIVKTSEGNTAVVLNYFNGVYLLAEKGGKTYFTKERNVEKS